MKLDLNQILAATRPKPVSLEYEGTEHVVRRLTVADVAAIESLRTPVDGESAADADKRAMTILRGLFQGQAPAFLYAALDDLSEEARAQHNRDVVAVASALLTIYVEDSLPKIAALAREETSRQITAVRAGTTTQTASTS